MNPRTVLMVAYYFPPLGGMGSVRAERFVRHLPAHGWRPVVVTAKRGMSHQPAGAWVAPEDADIMRTPSLELSRLARHAYGAAVGADTEEGAVLESVRAGRVGGMLRRALRQALYVPDAQIGWFPFAVRAGGKILVEQGAEVVYTTSVPYTAHLVGRAIQRRHGVPWVAEFRDLWSGSQAGEASSAVRRAVDRRIEADILREADAVVVTTPGAREALLETSPALDPRRVHVVPNAYESGAHPAARPPGPHEPMVIFHGGTLMPGLQDPTPILTAAGAVERASPGSVRVRVFGPPDAWTDALAASGAPAEVLEVRGFVSPHDIPGELARASCALILAPGATFRPVYLGKMLEWLGAGIPALAVVDPSGSMADVLRRAGGSVIVPNNDAALLERAITSLVEEHRAGALAKRAPDPAVAGDFEIGPVAARLAAVFDGVLGRGTPQP